MTASIDVCESVGFCLGWVMQGHGDMTMYVPMGMQVTKSESINVQYLTGTFDMIIETQTVQ